MSCYDFTEQILCFPHSSPITYVQISSLVFGNVNYRCSQRVCLLNCFPEIYDHDIDMRAVSLSLSLRIIPASDVGQLGDLQIKVKVKVDIPAAGRARWSSLSVKGEGEWEAGQYYSNVCPPRHKKIYCLCILNRDHSAALLLERQYSDA